MRNKVLFALVALVAASCTGLDKQIASTSDKIFALAKEQYVALDARLAPDRLPTSYIDGKPSDIKIDGWTSGFFPGSLWLIYKQSGDEQFLELAKKNTAKLDSLVYHPKTHHDIGFQIFSSFGNAYKMTGDTSYLATVKIAALKLASRFSSTVGCTKSWDNNKWEFPVIIDNMMNLELLCEAAKFFGIDSLKQIAVTHAGTTMRNHFRDDYSTWHLVDYDPETGEVLKKQTVQGYADDSSWSRGQAWALYGYTMMYREIGDESYLTQACNIADMLLPRLPEDGIPYWDFDAPGIPDDDRDSSAGAIMASALIELSSFVQSSDKAAAKRYKAMAAKQLLSLATDAYLAPVGENGNFLLMHAVGNKPGDVEVNVPLIYGDYYYLEALLRWEELL